MKRTAFLSLEEELPAVPSPYPRQRRFGGADPLRLPAGHGQGQLPCPGAELGDGPFPFLFFEAGELETDKAGEGGVGKLPPQGELIGEKPGIVMFLRTADGVMAGGEGLDDDPA